MQVATQRGGETPRQSINSHFSRLGVLAGILVTSIISTGFHYAHNYFEIDQYPDASWVSNSTTQAAIVVFWPLLTAAGIAGYWLYSRRRYFAAHVGLAIYSLTGLATLGHFMDGNPDIGPVWYATIFTDALVGIAMLAFVGWSILTFGRDSESTRA